MRRRPDQRSAAPRQARSRRPDQGHADGRQARSRRTRAKIRRAANELIIAKGSEGATVDAICGAAGIAKGTFYLHFRSKEELLLEYGNRRLEHVLSVLPEILMLPTARAALVELVNVVIKRKDWHPEVVRAVVLKLAENFDRLRAHDLHQLLLPIIELGVGRGELRDDIPAPILAGFVADAVYSGLRNWGMGLSGDDLDLAIDQALSLAYDAVRVR